MRGLLAVLTTIAVDAMPQPGRMKKICWNCNRWQELPCMPQGGVCKLNLEYNRFTEVCGRFQPTPPPPPEEIPTVGE